MPGARTLVQTMRAWGARTALVSGGFVPFVERVRAAIGFDLAQANRLETLNGRLTGRLLGPIRGPQSKLALLRQLDPGAAAAAGAKPWRSATAPTICRCCGAAGLGVAFRPTPAVAAARPCRDQMGRPDARCSIFRASRGATSSSG